MFNHDVVNFQVEKFHLTDVPTDIGVGLRRKDTGETLAIVSEQYTPTQYLEITDAVEEALNQSGLDLTDAEFETKSYDGGARLELITKFPAHPMEISEGDVVVPEFKFRTSHNSTWSNNGYVGAFRAFCYNSLVSGNVLGYVYGKHTKNFSVPQFAAKIRTAAEYIAGDGMEQMQRWCDTPIKRDTAIDLFTETLAHRQDNVKREAGSQQKETI